MDERRKIVIPIGTDPDSKSEQKFFDTQSRKDARPVVPLSGTPKGGPATGGTPSRKRLLLIVVLVTAVAVGISAVAYAFISMRREKAGPQTAVQPFVGKTLSTLPWTHTPEDPAADENASAADAENVTQTSETKAGNDPVANSGDPKKAGKQQKRGKSGNKNANDNSNDPVKRTQDELQRIREIFEGTP